MHMKYSTCFLLLFCALVAFAQNDYENDEMTGPDFERLQKRLNLNAQQVEDIKNLHSTLVSDAKRIREDPGVSKEEREMRLNELRKLHEKRMKEVLTEKQFNKFRSERMARRKRRMEKRRERFDKSNSGAED